jgi:hypothetical protein
MCGKKNHMFFKLIFFVIAITNINFCANKSSFDQSTVTNKAYYFSKAGNDNSDGSIMRPFKTISKLNQLHLQPGNAVYFHGGDTFEGSILINASEYGMKNLPILIGTYGKRNAVINSGNLTALTVYKTKYIHISNLTLVGSGSKEGNTKDGIAVIESSHITIDSFDISGFQKSGLLVYSSAGITVTHVYAHDNGAAGIGVEGKFGQKDCTDIYIGFCMAENNPGDPSNLTNHSGNGIVVGHCKKVTIEYCVATNNGWDMPRIGNGPVGIWGYEADSLLIQHCVAYRNKTSKGGADGGGFDLDGGVTNSTVQYCLSYENQGAGYCIFQYSGASPWYNNVFRYNISKDDGLVSDGMAGVYIWNSSGDKNRFYDCLFYNNTIYNTKRAAINYSEKSERKNFSFYNNIFITQDTLIKGEKGIDTFLANDWWSVTKKFNIEGIDDLTTWAQKNKQEMMNGKVIGLNIDPGFKNPDNPMPVSPAALKLFDQYDIPGNSLLRTSGLDLHQLFGIETGNLDFNGKPAPPNGIGACF